MSMAARRNLGAGYSRSLAHISAYSRSSSVAFLEEASDFVEVLGCFLKHFRDEVAVFYFVNHAWQKLLVVDVGLVILDFCFPNFDFRRFNVGFADSWVIFGDDVSDGALGFAADG